MVNNNFKKLLSVLLAVCLLVVCCSGFVACATIEVPQDNGIYYAYDVVTEEYDDDDYIEINGDKCKLVAELFGGKMTFDGTVEYNGSNVVVRYSASVGKVSADIAIYGEKEASGIIRFSRQETTSDGKTTTLYALDYYCKKGCAPQKQKPGDSDGVYYEYDPSNKEYDDDSTLTINGSVCKYSADFGGIGLTADASGTATFTGSGFVLDCAALGGRMVLSGVKEKDGVLRVDSVTTTVDDEDYTDTSVVYFCKKGTSPDNPVISEQNPLSGWYTITFDANGGKYYSAGTDTVTTDGKGKITYMPIYDPTRDGYVFVGYNTKKNGTGNTVDKGAVFDRDTTVYAVWAPEVTVTFNSNGMNVSKKKVGKGMPLGEFTVPGIEDYLSDYYLFKGWYNGGKQYLSTTIVEDDITLTADWYTPYEIQKYIDSLTYSTKPGHIYIHYWRFDHDHSEEGTTTTAAAPSYNTPIVSKTYVGPVYVEPDVGMTKGNGRYFYPMKIDMSGAVYDIDYTNVYHDAGDDGDLDTYYGGGDIWLTLCAKSSADGRHWITDGGSQYLSSFTDDYFAYDHVFFIQDNTYRRVKYNSKTGKFR